MVRTLIRLIILLTACTATAAPTAVGPLNIWQGTACRERVMLTPYLADGNDRPACIVCPGGSYFWLDRKTEGHDVARFLQSQGISAFVLEYRVGGVPAFITHYRLLARGHRYPDMLRDVHRSIQLLRENAATFGINPGRVGVMGFSAGGHLAAMSGIYFDTDLLGQLGITTSVSMRPDFVAPIYPVVSMTAPCTHKRSRRGALGEGAAISAAMKDSLSLERHVRPDMPPTYLLNCLDDPIVDYRNSVLLDSAMTANGVAHRYVQLRTGGHGFGTTAAKTTPEAAAWPQDFITWFKQIYQVPND